MWRKHTDTNIHTFVGLDVQELKKTTTGYSSHTQFHQTRLVFCAKEPIVLPVTEAHGWPPLPEVWLLTCVVFVGCGGELRHKNVRKTGL